MKYIITTRVFILLMLFAFTIVSCSKSFLEIEPKGNMIASNTDDYGLLLNTFNLTNINSNSQVVLGDEVVAIADNSYFQTALLKTQRLFKWEGVVYEPNEDASEMAVPMKNIYLYNEIINEVMHSKGGSDAYKKAIRAEAKAGRAWTYFLLVNYYGMPYHTSTADTDLAFPIIVESDVTQKSFTRASVNEVYNFIINDLKEAIGDLPVNLQNRLRMSKPAAEAILGKVYVFMGNYEDALPLFNSALTNIQASQIDVALYDYQEEFSTGGVFLPEGFYGPAYPSMAKNKEALYIKQFVNFWNYTMNELVLSQEASALFTPSDYRLRFYSNTAFYSSYVYPNGLLRRMGPNSTQFGVILPEIYLLRAECKARLNDLHGATNDLETLRLKRMPEADAIIESNLSNDQIGLIRFIIEERLREFAMQGFRWFDMRRLSVDPLFGQTNFEHHLVNQAGVVETFHFDSERFALKFPQKIMDQNPGMPNN